MEQPTLNPHSTTKEERKSVKTKDIVDYLNKTAGTKYKDTTAKTKKVIQARLNESFTVDDFKAVISTKTKQWTGTEYEKYLRPETLFGTKFEGYLNESPNKKTTQEVYYGDELC